MSKSIPFRNKLDKLFIEDNVVEEFDAMLYATDNTALRRFKNMGDLTKHLSEGALLNVNLMGSKSMSIPCGEYMVMTTDAGHTMLVPIESKKNYQEVFESKINEFEIQTTRLLNNWHNVERVLAEEADPNAFGGNESEGDSDEDDGGENRFKSKVDPADIDRSPLLRAMEQQGHTVTSLASAIGVQPPAISRLLRSPKERSGDPGGRNPSIGTASAVSNELRAGVELLFPDIFGASQTTAAPRDQSGNRGSGKSVGKNSATKKWTQGNG